MEKINYDSAKAPFQIKADGTYQIILKKTSIDLEIDPNECETADDQFTLYSTDQPVSYCATKTVKDDKIDGDNMISLVFYSLPEDLNYTMEIDPGKDGEKYFLFEDIPFERLKST